MKTNFYYAILITLVACLQSCSDDDSPGAKKYDEGVLIVNEGQFGAGTGTVTYLNPANGELVQNIYKNTEDYAGDVLQSVTLTSDKAYLVLNNDSKIEIANESTFAAEKTITAPAMVSPRYVEIINGKAYISVWGPFVEMSLVDSYVLVVDATTLAPVDTIDTDEGTENLLYNGTYLFASNYNFGGSSTLAVIDPTDNELVDQLELYPGPSGMVLDKNNKLWVIATGTFSGDGKLFRINPTTLEIEDEIDLGIDPSSDLAINPAKDELVYTSGKDIFRIAITAEEAPTEPWVTVTDAVVPYALGVDPTTGEVYFGDALNYVSPGLVYIYNTNGTLKTTVTSGICPTQFVFRK